MNSGATIGIIVVIIIVIAGAWYFLSEPSGSSYNTGTTTPNSGLVPNTGTGGSYSTGSTTPNAY